MTFTFPDGSVGVVDYLANGDKSFSKERVEVFCGERVAVLDDFRVLEMVRDGKRKTIKRSQDKGHAVEMQAFANAIRSGGKPPISYDQLVGVTQATISTVQALRIGQLVTINPFVKKP
jgi:predicted dehydrogenase